MGFISLVYPPCCLLRPTFFLIHPSSHGIQRSQSPFPYPESIDLGQFRLLIPQISSLPIEFSFTLPMLSSPRSLFNTRLFWFGIVGDMLSSAGPFRLSHTPYGPTLSVTPTAPHLPGFFLRPFVAQQSPTPRRSQLLFTSSSLILR